MIRKNVLHMMRTSRFQLFSLIFIGSFLLLFTNILIVVAQYMQSTGATVRQKLGIYFYLDDATSSPQDTVYTQTIQLLSELEQVGLQADFYSKEDAFRLLEKRLPNVIGNLEKYGIANPLPPTLYVTFRNQQDYEVLKSLIIRYDDIIMNMEDLQASWSFDQQQNRVAKVIGLTNFVSYGAYFLIAIILVIIIAFLLYAIQINFFRFQTQIELEKLLWATYGQIKAPFLWYVLAALCMACLLNATYLAIIFNYINTYFIDVFGASVYSIVATPLHMGTLLITESIIIIFLCLVFTQLYLGKLLRRV